MAALPTDQIRQFDTDPAQGPKPSVLFALALPPPKAVLAEINSAGYLRNPAYTRP